MKPKWQLRLKGCTFKEASRESLPTSSTSIMTSPSTSNSRSTISSAISSPKIKNTRHLALHHEKVSAKKMEVRNDEMRRAVQYCRDNNCKGYKALKDLGLQYVKDARTINQHLLGNVTTGDEKQNLKLLKCLI